MPEKKKINWSQIKTEYITTEINYRDLAKKYDVSLTALRQKARKTDKRPGWVSLRQEHRQNVNKKAIKKIETQQINDTVSNIDRVLKIAEKVIEKIDRAADELDRYMVKSCEKKKTTVYDKTSKKPSKEVEKTIENLVEVQGIINTESLKKVTSSLKDIQEVLKIEDNKDEETGVIFLPAQDTVFLEENDCEKSNLEAPAKTADDA